MGIYTEMGTIEPAVEKRVFLKLVPSECRPKASKLLDWIEANPLIVRWDIDGVITLEDEQIPNTNIFNIFPQLYSTDPDFKVPGYISLASVILDAGLGSLVCTHSFSANTSRKRKFSYKDQTHKVGKKVTPWYYLND